MGCQGGASGIGLAAATILANKGADVHILDLNQPIDTLSTKIRFRQCDVTNWIQLRDAVDSIPRLDFAFANAGIVENTEYFTDILDSDGKLQQPTYDVLGVNFTAVVNLVKLAWSSMRRNKIQGSIVITTSATAYAPEQSLPVFAGTKLAVSSMMRCDTYYSLYLS